MRVLAGAARGKAALSTGGETRNARRIKRLVVCSQPGKHFHPLPAAQTFPTAPFCLAESPAGNPGDPEASVSLLGAVSTEMLQCEDGELPLPGWVFILPLHLHKVEGERTGGKKKKNLLLCFFWVCGNG